MLEANPIIMRIIRLGPTANWCIQHLRTFCDGDHVSELDAMMISLCRARVDTMSAGTKCFLYLMSSVHISTSSDSDEEQLPCGKKSIKPCGRAGVGYDKLLVSESAVTAT